MLRRLKARWGQADAFLIVSLTLWTAGCCAVVVRPSCLGVIPIWAWFVLLSCNLADLVLPLASLFNPPSPSSPLPPPPPEQLAVIAPDLRAKPLQRTLASCQLLDVAPQWVLLYVDEERSASARADLLAALPPNARALVNDSGQKAGKFFGLETLRNALPPSVHYVLQTDGGTRFRPNAFREALQPLLADPRVAAVSGSLRIRPEWSQPLVEAQRAEFLLIGSARHTLSRLGMLWVVGGAFSLFRRDSLDCVKGWTCDPGEDAVLGLDLLTQGHRAAHAAEAIGYTGPKLTVSGLWAQRLRWSRTLVRCVLQYLPRLLRNRQWGIAAGLVLDATLSLAGPLAFYLGIAILAVLGHWETILAVLATGGTVLVVLTGLLLVVANRQLRKQGHPEDVVPLRTALLMPLYAEVLRSARVVSIGMELLATLPGGPALVGPRCYDPFLPPRLTRRAVVESRRKWRQWGGQLLRKLLGRRRGTQPLA